jgi:anaerobic selenocysteine-containing dehydrogenase
MPTDRVATASGKIEVCIAELEEQAKALNAATEKEDLKLPDEFPLILNAGRHMKYNANTPMRNPDWNTGKRPCTIAMHPNDIRTLGFSDGQQVRVTTEPGNAVAALEMSDAVRQGTVLIPQGFGLELRVRFMASMSIG